jgi:phage terminase small subunit
MSLDKRYSKEKRFAEEWLTNGGNATKAYLYIKPIVSKESAGELGSKLLKNVKVQEIIKESQNKTSQELKITRESLLKDYEDIKRRNIGDSDKVAILAMQEQAKLLGLNAPVESHNTNLNVDAELTNEEKTDLARAINELKETKVSSKK